jgi:dihydrofolate synthase/folylpolyglutamate synthase
MRALLRELGDPQERFPAIHVVGTNGKSTTTRLTEALLLDAGLSVGAYISPHVVRWEERIRVNGAESDLERALTGVRPPVESLSATQFEALTAAALLAFAEAEVDVAVVEAGLGGRHDATNVLRTRVVVLTSVALDHMEVLGDTREAIAAEKLAVVQPGCIVVLGEPEWRELAEENGAGAVVVTGRSNLALAVAAAESFLDRPVDPHAADAVALPGRLERRGERPLEIWDGAHNLAGIGTRPGARCDGEPQRPCAPRRRARRTRVRAFRPGRGGARAGRRPRPCARARGPRRSRGRHGLPVPSGRSQWRAMRPIALPSAATRSSRSSPSQAPPWS